MDGVLVARAWRSSYQLKLQASRSGSSTLKNMEALVGFPPTLLIESEKLKSGILGTLSPAVRCQWLYIHGPYRR